MSFMYVCIFLGFVLSFITESLAASVFLLGALLSFLFFFSFFLHVKSQANNTQRSHSTVQTTPQVKYLQFVESIVQYLVHLR